MSVRAVLCMNEGGGAICTKEKLPSFGRKRIRP